jgi:hypothetical protein
MCLADVYRMGGYGLGKTRKRNVRRSKKDRVEEFDLDDLCASAHLADAVENLRKLSVNCAREHAPFQIDT